MTKPLWSLTDAASALDLAPCEGERAIGGVSIDSRTVQPGDLFVAILGENMDGHRFVNAAFEGGAAAAIVSQDVPDASGPLLKVPDTLEALNMLGRAARARTLSKISAVTGSVGKTGTKEMLRTALGACGAVHASEKSYNNLWGVPLSLARMPAATKFGVFEIGMNHAGEIVPLTTLVRPHIALITWIAPVHIEFFASTAEIADAKAEIFEGMEPGGFAILPADNEHYDRLCERALARRLIVVPFGEAGHAQSRLLNVQAIESGGSRVKADILGETVDFTLPVPGRHLAANAVAALTAAKLSGADLQTAASALAAFEAPEGRGRRSVLRASDGGRVLLIDETYNANPASMRAALDVLGAVPRADFPRRIAVLGDMLELGKDSARFHADLAASVDAYDTDLVFCVGPLMTNLYKRLPSHKQGGYCETSEDLKSNLLKIVRGGDAITIKGSLGSRMGLLADAVRAHFADS